LKGVIFISPAGRPHKENPRNVNLNIRIKKDEANRIQKCADELELTRTDTIMKGIGLVEKELADNKKE
jgi:hypothetical protein